MVWQKWQTNKQTNKPVQSGCVWDQLTIHTLGQRLENRWRAFVNDTLNKTCVNGCRKSLSWELAKLTLYGHLRRSERWCRWYEILRPQTNSWNLRLWNWPPTNSLRSTLRSPKGLVFGPEHVDSERTQLIIRLVIVSSTPTRYIVLSYTKLRAVLNPSKVVAGIFGQEHFGCRRTPRVGLRKLDDRCDCWLKLIDRTRDDDATVGLLTTTASFLSVFSFLSQDSSRLL